jgi:ABC-2 type transport system permease protein
VTAVASSAERSSTMAQMAALSVRSILGAARQPANWVPGIFFPFMLAAVYSSQFSKAVDLPAWPFQDISFLEFILPAAVLQGVSFGAINGGSELALDIENGFMDRLLSSPVSRPAILVGRLAGSMAYAVALACILLIGFALMGADVAGGIGAIVVLLITAALLALLLGSLGAALALRTGSQEVVQSIFPLIFVFIFASSAFFPVNLMEGWYGDLAANNPLTWIIDPVRRLIVIEFTWADAARAVAVAGGLAAGGVGVAFLALRRRMARL